ncbi:MAG: hypothetical protein EOP47_30705 [Sphingobacteriaceae bacterium]|nr:MAG: hypothetical protein EOP47_30705 [Sphingobacteriaceae bacterium]
MKVYLFLLVVVVASSCCFITQRKCSGFDNQYLFRLQNAGGQDLVFGSNKQCPLHSISAFSLNNNDSLFHQLYYQVIDNNDTVVSVIFNYEKHDVVYLKLGSSGNNTLVNTTRNITADCCNDYDEIVPVTFNGANVLSANNINILVK